MPVRPLNREQGWLLPYSLEDLLPSDHPARFVGAFVEQLEPAVWLEMTVPLHGEARGAPAYDPRLLLSVWLYGFMTGVRSCRKLEVACREQLPYIWLTGLQTPDHNTLWRFYQAYRQPMRLLLKRTVKTAVRAGLIDLAVQAVDGSKVWGSAAKGRTYTAAGLRRLLEKTAAAIADLEAQNQTAGDAVPVRLPAKLRQKQALAARVRQALRRVQEDESRENLTDRDAVLLRGKDGFVAGYNVQAVVSPLSEKAGRSGQLITAAMATQATDDHGQLLPMVEAAETNLGEQATTTLADGGYHSGENLSRMAGRGQRVLMPEAQAKALASRYHKDAFIYDAQSDSYTCPLGQTLHYSGQRKDRKGRVTRLYRAEPHACRTCPAFGQCTTDYRHGRALEVGPDDASIRRHRDLMKTPEARAVYSRRKELIEPTFGIIKEQLNGRRLLLRGLENVDAEWVLLGVGFNLKVLARIWRSGLFPALIRAVASRARLHQMLHILQPF